MLVAKLGPAGGVDAVRQAELGYDGSGGICLRFALGQHKRSIPVPVTRVPDGLFGGGVHVRGDGLVHKGAKAHAQVAGGAVHGLGQALAQRPQAVEVVVHGVGEVHEVVEVHGVVLDLPHFDRKALGVV